MAAPCAGAAIPSRKETGNWVQATCRVDQDEAIAVGVTARPGLAVTDGEGPGLAGAGMIGPGRSGVNPQEGRTETGIWGAGDG